jgi:copper oxidase (laccase) domain-containing protein
VTEAPCFLDVINRLGGFRAAWVGRIPGIAVDVERDEAMRRLRASHEAAVAGICGERASWWRAEQVHGNAVAVVPGVPVVEAADGLPVVSGVDGLVTDRAGVVLAIYVADCGAIWLADRKTGAVGLLHSGKKGTEGNIFAVGLRTMSEAYGTRPEDVVAVLGPCIRPPDYEVDFAAEIARQAAAAGTGGFVDCAENTAADPSGYYSYRKESGKTGRMMALICRNGDF